MKDRDGDRNQQLLNTTDLLRVKSLIDNELANRDGELDEDAFRSVHSKCDLQMVRLPGQKGDPITYDHNLDLHFYDGRLAVRCETHQVSSQSWINTSWL